MIKLMLQHSSIACNAIGYNTYIGLLHFAVKIFTFAQKETLLNIGIDTMQEYQSNIISKE